MKPTHYLLAILLLSGCSASQKLKRAEKLIARAEAAGAHWKIDTVFQEVPIITERLQVDTLISWQEAIKDTITVTVDRVTTKVKIVPGKPVYVETTAKADTVIVKVPVVVNKTISAKGYSGWGLTWRLIAAFLAGAIVGTIVLKVMKLISFL